MARKTSEQKKQEERYVAISDIVGMAEIAERTGSSPHAVWNWTKRYEFPKPIATASHKPVWDWAEVDQWNQNWVRSKGGWHTHKANREDTSNGSSTRRRRPRRQVMEGDTVDERRTVKR